jgi:hypothetical protein
VHVTGTGEVVQKGSHSQTNQGGIYLTRSSMALHPQYAMESWRAFTQGDNALSADPLYTDGAMLQLFIADSWTVLDSLRDVWGQDMLKEYTGESVCQPVMVGRDGLPFDTGCTHPDYPSMSGENSTTQRSPTQPILAAAHEWHSAAISRGLPTPSA